MKVDVIVLAGAPNDKALKEESDSPLEALIEVGGRPMVAHVIDALKSSARIGRIVLVGPDEPLAAVARDYGGSVELAGDGGSLVDNLQRGFDFLGSERPVLIVTSDVPLLTGEAVDDFLARCDELEADVYYPVIERSVSEARFPGAVRTYVRLADGEFTGGNCVLLAARVLARHRKVIEQAVAMRKNPIALSRLFGFRLFFKLVTGRLRIEEVENHFRQVLGLRGVAVRCRYPEIGLDVDKPADLAMVRRFFGAG